MPVLDFYPRAHLFECMRPCLSVYVCVCVCVRVRVRVRVRMCVCERERETERERESARARMYKCINKIHGMAMEDIY